MFHCASCGVVTVEVEDTYCDLCVEEIVSWLEKENNIWLEKKLSEAKYYELLAEEFNYQQGFQL